MSEHSEAASGLAMRHRTFQGLFYDLLLVDAGLRARTCSSKSIRVLALAADHRLHWSVSMNSSRASTSIRSPITIADAFFPLGTAIGGIGSWRGRGDTTPPRGGHGNFHLPRPFYCSSLM